MRPGPGTRPGEKKPVATKPVGPGQSASLRAKLHPRSGIAVWGLPDSVSQPPILRNPGPRCKQAQGSLEQCFYI